jgi:hypothetical protein
MPDWCHQRPLKASMARPEACLELNDRYICQVGSLIGEFLESTLSGNINDERNNSSLGLLLELKPSTHRILEFSCREVATHQWCCMRIVADARNNVFTEGTVLSGVLHRVMEISEAIHRTLARVMSGLTRNFRGNGLQRWSNRKLSPVSPADAGLRTTAC